MTQINQKDKEIQINKDWENLLNTLAKRHIGDYTVTNEGNTILLRLNGSVLMLNKDKTWGLEAHPFVGAPKDLVEAVQQMAEGG